MNIGKDSKEGMKRVLVFGSFDGVHRGHVYFLQTARKHGDELVVVVALDKTIAEIKGKPPARTELQRRRELLDLDFVDSVYYGNEGDKLTIVEELNPDVICLGYDQVHFTSNLDANLNKRGLNPKIIRIDAYEPDRYKSSLLNK